jgi:hypothetical protein
MDNTAPKPITCVAPVRVLLEGSEPQPCGRPAIGFVTVTVLGVKVMHSFPLCHICGEHFTQSGIQMTFNPIGKIAIAPADVQN